jgi:hypothetical protein
MDSYNQLVKAVCNYKAQEVRTGGSTPAAKTPAKKDTKKSKG